jgi:Putative abortive phage resistance protein AbiGi, antitoxin
MPPRSDNDPQPANGDAEADQARAEREDYLGETLYHFLGHGSTKELMSIFDSIVRRGLLMTVGDKNGNLDRLAYEIAPQVNQSYELMQKARVCFTDIPRYKLFSHSGEYGKFALGFSRKTIISWGGNPVLYVPNHVDSPLTSVMGGLISRLCHAAFCLEMLDNYCSGGLKPFMKPDLFNSDDLPIFMGAHCFVGEERRDFLLTRCRNSIMHLLAFVKQMSHNDVNDFSYLYEREWRIVCGLQVNGQEIARELTADEKTELCEKRSRWGQPLEVASRPFFHREHAAMIDLFMLFNGTGESTVAKNIEHILVPSLEMQKSVNRYLIEQPQMFADVPPTLGVLDS